jgi:arabinofuranosyltransferase
LTAPHPYRKGPLGSPALTYGVAALLFALTVSLFTWNVGRHAFLGDDAFISFRYARNLYEGHGLVWNPGGRVEGYTNFLWVLIMALGMSLRLQPEVLSNMIGTASGVVVLVLLLRLSSKQAGSTNPLIWLTPLVLATSRTFTAWCTGGLATMFFTMLVFAALVRFVWERERRTTLPIASSLLFALALLTRPEGYIFAATAGAFFVGDLAMRKRALRPFLVWGLPLAAVAASHLIWRHAYYGYWLPNSFYAKVSGFWGRQAYHYLSMFQRDYKVFFFAPLALLCLVVRRRFIYALFVAAVVAYLVYVIYVGGDRFEFRFLVPVFPLFYWLLVEGIGLLASLKWRPSRVPHMGIWVGIALSVALWVTTYTGSRRPEARVTRYDIASLEEIKAYGERRAKEGKFIRELIDRGLLPDDLVLCVTGAGAVPYYTELPTVDLYGMNDTHIAHQEVAKRGVIAHEKRGSTEYMQERRVEMYDRLNMLVCDAPVTNQSCTDNRGCWKSIHVGRYYLNFITFLPDAEFEKRFARILRAPDTMIEYGP